MLSTATVAFAATLAVGSLLFEGRTMAQESAERLQHFQTVVALASELDLAVLHLPMATYAVVVRLVLGL